MRKLLQQQQRPTSSSSSLVRMVLLWLVLSTCPLTAQALALTPSAAWSAYKSLLKAHPLATKSVTAAVLSGLSDSITQRVERQNAKMEEQQSQKQPSEDGDTKSSDSTNKVAMASVSASVAVDSFDAVRSAQVMLTGLIWSGPSAHYWYTWLEVIVQTILPSSWQSAPLTAVLSRSLLDALLFSPVTIAGYFCVRTLLETRGSFQAVLTKWRRAWWPTLQGAWKFWPAVNWFSFALVPVQYRVLYANIMALLWTGYLSFVNQKQRRAAAATVESKQKST